MSRPCPRKIITRVIAFLLLGAIVNVAVSWGCVAARGIQCHSTSYYHNPSGTHPLAIAMTELPGYSIVTGVDRSGTLLYREPESVKHYGRCVWWNDEALQSWNNNFAVACGWPVLALTSWRTVLGEDETAFPGVIHQGVLWQSIVSPAAKGNAETFTPILALLPIWPGFAINTIFYAAILWLLFFAPGSVRRTLRRRRGLCPACAYPVGTSPVCTECGGAVT